MFSDLSLVTFTLIYHKTDFQENHGWNPYILSIYGHIGQLVMFWTGEDVIPTMVNFSGPAQKTGEHWEAEFIKLWCKDRWRLPKREF